jgi:hypothetical protein
MDSDRSRWRQAGAVPEIMAVSPCTVDRTPNMTPDNTSDVHLSVMDVHASMPRPSTTPSTMEVSHVRT